MVRVFLDANVLFSAAYRFDSPPRTIWESAGTRLLTSGLAVEEARRNLKLKKPSALGALEELLEAVEQVPTPDAGRYPESVQEVAEKDRPLLAAAIASRADWFLTGDRKDFGHLMGEKIEGVMIALPRTYLESR